MTRAGREITGSWQLELARLGAVLAAVSVRDGRGRALAVDAGFALWQAWTLALRRRRGTLYLIGNGASASMASHYAADLAKNAHVHTEVFSDLSLITAISNDLGYEVVFTEPLRRRARRGDMLVAISSSGKSPNILHAARWARGHGLAVITLSAMAEANPLRRLGRLNFYVPAMSYGHAETCHAAILHRWMDLVELKPS